MALQLNSSSTKLTLKLGYAYFACGHQKTLCGQFKEALIELSKAISLDENSADYYYERARCWIYLEV